MSLGVDSATANPPLPRVAVVLLVGAAGHVVILVAARAVTNMYMELSPLAVINDMLRAMPLVLAASIVAGWVRWPAAHRWFVAAAMAFVLVAILDITGSVVAAITWPPDPANPNPAPVVLRSALWLAGLIGAPLLAAVGIWRTRVSSAVTGRRAPLQWLFVAVAGAVVIISFIPVLAYYDDILPFVDGENQEPLLAALSAVYLLTPVAYALLGIAALGAAPRRYFLPEVVIAAGAMGYAVASAAAQAAPSVLNSAAWSSWLPGVVIAAQAAALVAVAFAALGFFAARVSAPGVP